MFIVLIGAPFSIPTMTCALVRGFFVSLSSTRRVIDCGLPGQMPMILATFTEHWGFQLIPLNLVLWVVVSFLVGLNFTMMAKAFSIAKKSKGLGIFGAATGCFVGCPTCAGTIFFLLTNMGITATTTATTIFLTTHGLQLQSIFMAISIPALLATPYIMAKAIRKSSRESCSIK